MAHSRVFSFTQQYFAAIGDRDFFAGIGNDPASIPDWNPCVVAFGEEQRATPKIRVSFCTSPAYGGVVRFRSKEVAEDDALRMKSLIDNI